MRGYLLAGACALGLAFTAAAPAAAAETGAQRYLIVLKGNAKLSGLKASVEKAGGSLVRVLPQVNVAVARSSNPNFSSQMAGDAKVQDIDVEAAHTLPDATTIGEKPLGAVSPAAFGTLEPTAGDDLFNAGLVWGVERVHAPRAWEVATGTAAGTGAGALIGIIDSGIASNHPDLGPKLAYQACYTSAGTWEGEYEEGAPCNPYPAYSDHGTHVAGTAAAAFGGGRVVGVAPNAQLANFNTFEPIEGCGVCTYTSSRWEAMIDAAEMGVDVINMSLGGTYVRGGRGSNDVSAAIVAEKRVSDYVRKQGTVIVASAGNDGYDNNGPVFHTPGDTPGQLNTSATGIRPEPRYEPGVSYDVLAFYSNFGAAVDVAAPGGDCGLPDSCDPETRPANWFEYLVLSSTVRPDPACAATQSCTTGYGWKAGTSMAAPHVAGVAAIAKATHGSASASQISTIVKQTADKVGDRQKFGHGVVDAYEAALK